MCQLFYKAKQNKNCTYKIKYKREMTLTFQLIVLILVENPDYNCQLGQKDILHYKQNHKHNYKVALLRLEQALFHLAARSWFATQQGPENFQYAVAFAGIRMCMQKLLHA
jgi:hypothetical protein